VAAERSEASEIQDGRRALVFVRNLRVLGKSKGDSVGVKPSVDEHFAWQRREEIKDIRIEIELHRSACITIIGLTQPARHAGTAAALTVTTDNTTAAAINTTGSRVDVSNNRGCRSGAATT